MQKNIDSNEQSLELRHYVVLFVSLLCGLVGYSWWFRRRRLKPYRASGILSIKSMNLPVVIIMCMFFTIFFQSCFLVPYVALIFFSMLEGGISFHRRWTVDTDLGSVRHNI